MKITKTNFKQMLLITALSGALALPLAMADYKSNGKVEAINNGDGTSTIRITDPDKIKWYTVYDKIFINRAWEPAFGLGHVNEDCKQTTVDIKLDARHLLHGHLVKYADCKNPSKIEIWSDVFHALWLENFRPGKPLIYETAVNYPKEDTDSKMEVGFKIEDVNNDMIPDMAITRENESAVGVAVMKGNGDGSFQQPSADNGTLIIIPLGN